MGKVGSGTSPVAHRTGRDSGPAAVPNNELTNRIRYSMHTPKHNPILIFFEVYA